MSKKVIWLDRDLVRNPLYLGVCDNEKALAREMKRIGIKKADRPAFCHQGKDALVHFFEKEGRSMAIVCLHKDCKKNHTRSEILGLICHEAVHVWQEVKLSMGEHSPSPEFEAYSIQTIAQKIYEAFYK